MREVMNKNKITAVILAAGKGSRMRSNSNKVLHKIGNKPLINHSIDLCKTLNISDITVILGHQGKKVSESIPSDIKLVYQKNQVGTANALSLMKNKIKSNKGILLVLYADVFLIKLKTIRSLIKKANNCLSIVGFCPDTSEGYGRLILENKTVRKIIEHKLASFEQKKISLCNSGIFAGPSKLIFKLLGKINIDKQIGEYLLTDIFEESSKLGVNTRKDLSILENYFQKSMREKIMKSGVSLKSPDSVYFSYDTKISRDVFIGPNVIFGEEVNIGEGSIIASNCHIEGAKISKYCKIGPFARLRPYTKVKDFVNIGNFVEIKNSTIGKKAKVNHLAYIGDAYIGINSNIGAGTITCNYDGIKKNKTKIGKNVFIGSNSSLIAPLVIKDSTFVAAGSVVTENSSEGDLVISRSRQKNIKNGKDKLMKKLNFKVND